MPSTIDMSKPEAGEERVEKQNFVSIKDMQQKIICFCNKLLDDELQFNVEETMEYLVSYMHDCHRILYSEFSNLIYAYYEKHNPNDASQKISTMLSHIEKLIDYTQTNTFKEKLLNSNNAKDYEDASKAVIKIWDHISLAQQQYNMLKMSDTEYKQKIDERLSPFQRDLLKELNSQLLTMIGIFTALAFLLFGGISSLENLFANSSMPTLKFMVVGSIWGFCLLNLLYIFLFCVGKMSNLKFGSEEDYTIFQKYAIVWWSDFILVTIMCLSFWAYYLQKNNSYQWANNLFLKHSFFFTVIWIGIACIMGSILIKLTKKRNLHKTKHLQNPLLKIFLTTN